MKDMVEQQRSDTPPCAHPDCDKMAQFEMRPTTSKDRERRRKVCALHTGWFLGSIRGVSAIRVRLGGTS